MELGYLRAQWVGPPTRTGVLRRVCRRTGGTTARRRSWPWSWSGPGQRAMELGYLRAQWVAGDDAFGMSPSFREGLEALGMWYVLDVPGSIAQLYGLALGAGLDQSGISRVRATGWQAANPGCGLGSAGPWSSAVMNCRMRPGRSAGKPITVAQGSQGPRTYRFSAQRVRATRRRKPEYEEGWAVWRRNLRSGQRRTMEQRGDELPTAGLAGDNAGKPGAAHLPVQRPAGAGHQEAQARRGGMGRLAPEPGRQRAPLLPVQRLKTQPWRPWRTWVGPGGALKRSLRLRRATLGWTNTRPAAGQAGTTT